MVSHFQYGKVYFWWTWNPEGLFGIYDTRRIYVTLYYSSRPKVWFFCYSSIDLRLWPQDLQVPMEMLKLKMEVMGIMKLKDFHPLPTLLLYLIEVSSYLNHVILKCVNDPFQTVGTKN